MIIENSIKMPAIIQSANDSILLYVLSKADTIIGLSVIDSDSCKNIASFWLQLNPNTYSSPCVDNDCLYLPTDDGQIIAIDKFSGSKHVTIDFGPIIIMSDLLQDEENIYTLCGIPISSKTKTDTSRYSICVGNKETGKQVAQSELIKADNIFINVDTDIFIIHDKQLSCYSKLGEHKYTIDLNFRPSYKPILTPQYVVCASSNGALEIFNKEDLSSYRLMAATTNFAPPVNIKDNILLWHADRFCHKIDVEKREASMGAMVKNSVNSEPVCQGQYIYAADKCNIIRNEMSTLEESKLDIEEHIQRLAPTGKHLFAICDSVIHKIGQEDE